MKLLLLLILLGAQNAYTAVSVDKLRKAITRDISSGGIPRSQLGVWIGYKGQKIYSLNGEKKLIPASVSKVLPAAASLSKFKNSHQFITRIYTTGNVSNGTLDGNIYLVGGGDPSFTSENMWVLVNEFIRSGIKRVTGDIIVDDQRFDDVRFDPGRDEDASDRDKSYTAPVGAMSFNWNSVNIVVRPGKRSGEKAVVHVNPENDYIEVINNTTTRSGSRNSISVVRLGMRFTIDGHPKDTVRVSGSIGLRSSEVSIYRNITRPDFWSGANLKSFLKQRGVTVDGTLRAGSKPNSAKKRASVAGKTLSQSISDMMKFSNNYVAEMLTKNLAYQNNKQPQASMDQGLEEIRRFLDGIGWERKNYTLTSPSGLSRKNRFRAKDVHALLEKLRLDSLNFPEYLSAQAVAGTDGTLRNRMKGETVFGRVRGKTGTLSGVAGLAGYVLRKDGEVITFAFLFNGGAGVGNARKLFDRMAISLSR